MTGVKISGLPAATAANDTDQLETNQGGVSRRVTVDQLGERIASSEWVQDAIAAQQPGVHYATAFGVVGDGVTDNADALQAAVNSFSGAGGKLLLPQGVILTSKQIQLPSPTWTEQVIIEGVGKSTTQVVAIQDSFVWTGKAVFYRDGPSVGFGGGLRAMTIDAAKIADYAVYFATGKGVIIEDLICANAIVTEGLFGHPTTPRFFESKFIGCSFYTDSTVYTDAQRPPYNLHLQALASDNELIRVTCNNAYLSNVRIDGGGCTVSLCHFYGFPAAYVADYCLELGGSTSAVNTFCDCFAEAGIYIKGGATAVVACRFQFAFDPVTPVAIRVATGLTGLVISNNTQFLAPSTKTQVQYEGTQPANSYIQSDVIRTDGIRLLLGGGSSEPALAHARLQLAGTDFTHTSLGQGRWSADASGPVHVFYKSRGAAVGDSGPVTLNDVLGTVTWMGDDGSATPQPAAQLIGRASSGIGSSDMPGQLEFWTTPDGAVTPVLRGVFDHRGNLTMGSAALATSATAGFVFLAGMPGAPTGTPSIPTGRAPIAWNSTNRNLWVHDGTAWMVPTLGAPVTKTADFTVAISENWLINNKAASTCTVTLPAAATYPGRQITLQNYQAFTVVSATANVVPLGGGAAAVAILGAVAGRWATLVSNGTNWVIMAGVV